MKLREQERKERERECVCVYVIKVIKVRVKEKESSRIDNDRITLIEVEMCVYITRSSSKLSESIYISIGKLPSSDELLDL